MISVPLVCYVLFSQNNSLALLKHYPNIVVCQPLGPTT